MEPSQGSGSSALLRLASAEELAASLEEAAVPMHWVGPNGVILWANRAELELLGYPRDSYVGRHICDFHVDPAACEAILGLLGAGNVLRDYPARLRHSDGSTCDVLINSNVQWRDGAFAHTRCFTRSAAADDQA